MVRELLALVVVALVAALTFTQITHAQPRGAPGFPPGPGNPIANLQRQIDELGQRIGGGDFSIVTVSAETAQTTGSVHFISVDCPPGATGGQTVLTGGGSTVTGFPAGTAIQQSSPTQPGSTGWSAQAAREPSAFFDPSSPWGLRVFALCANVAD